MEYIIKKNNDYLIHYGVPGMKWGHRKAIYYEVTGNRSRMGSMNNGQTNARVRRSNSTISNRNSKSQKTELTPEQKSARRKKALKIGAAVAGTALAAYGTYKLAKYVQDKRQQAAMKKASEYIDKNFLNKIGESNFTNGKKISYYADNAGQKITIEGRGNKIIGQHNAKIVSTGRQMYKDATNTRLDKGLSKIVGAGESVGNATKRIGETSKNVAKRVSEPVKRAGTTVKNRVLDVVDPIYTYEPGQTNVKTRNIGGVNYTEKVTDYYKRKVRR